MKTQPNLYLLDQWQKGKLSVDDASALLDEITKITRVHDALRSVGISKSQCTYYASPRVQSGYSMGEVIYVYCNDKQIEYIDNRSYYKGDFKGRETHGRIIVRFTKKSLRDCIGALMEAETQLKYACGATTEERKQECHARMIEAMTKANNIVKSAISKESKIKGGV